MDTREVTGLAVLVGWSPHFWLFGHETVAETREGQIRASKAGKVVRQFVIRGAAEAGKDRGMFHGDEARPNLVW